MLNTLRDDGFDSLLTLISIKMHRPQPLHQVCIIFAHTGARVKATIEEKRKNCIFPLTRAKTILPILGSKIVVMFFKF